MFIIIPHTWLTFENFPWWIIRRHGQLSSWEKTIDSKGKWDAKICICCSLIAVVPFPPVFVKILQGPSLSSALFGHFRLPKLDHRHRPFRLHSYLQRGTSSIKQLLLGQITGWSIERFAALSTSQSQTTFLAGLVYKLDIWEATLEVVVSLVSSPVQPCPGGNSLLSEKRQLTFVLSKEPIQSPPG